MLLNYLALDTGKLKIPWKQLFVIKQNFLLNLFDYRDQQLVPRCIEIFFLVFHTIHVVPLEVNLGAADQAETTAGTTHSSFRLANHSQRWKQRGNPCLQW